MRIFVIIALFLVVPSSLRAEEDVLKQKVFPASWEGVWKGPSKIIRNNKTVLEFPMELHIAPLKEGKGWSWKILYGEGEKQQTRPYELIPVREEMNHYQIDEKNGILIAAFFENDTLHSRFWIGDTVIESTYARAGHQMIVTLTTFGAKPVHLSGGNGKVPRVASYELGSVQRAAMRRH